MAEDSANDSDSDNCDGTQAKSTGTKRVRKRKRLSAYKVSEIGPT